MIELEPRERKESDDGNRPGPQQRFKRVDGNAPKRPVRIVVQPTGEQAGPRQEARGQNSNVKPHTGLSRVHRPREQQNVFVEDIAFDESSVEPPPHIEVPRERYAHDDGQSDQPMQSEQPAPSFTRHCARERKREPAQDERQGTFRQHGESAENRTSPLERWPVFERSYRRERRAAKQERRKKRGEKRV